MYAWMRPYLIHDETSTLGTPMFKERTQILVPPDQMLLIFVTVTVIEGKCVSVEHFPSCQGSPLDEGFTYLVWTMK